MSQFAAREAPSPCQQVICRTLHGSLLGATRAASTPLLSGSRLARPLSFTASPPLGIRSEKLPALTSCLQLLPNVLVRWERTAGIGAPLLGQLLVSVVKGLDVHCLVLVVLSFRLEVQQGLPILIYELFLVFGRIPIIWNLRIIRLT